MVHLVGSGTADDPLRPEYAPTQPGADRRQILAWSFLLSDDRKMAIVQFVAADRSAFAPILADKRPEVRVFDPRQISVPQIEAALQLLRKDFSLERIRVFAQ